MNTVWLILVVASVAVMLFDSPETVLSVMLEAGSRAISMCVTLCAVYIVWLGLFRILENCGAIAFLANVMKPVVKVVYGEVSDKANEYICLNLSGNLLGVGSAATPAAIKAVETMQQEVMTAPVAMLFVINATSIQLLPTTVIGMRAKFGSFSPSDIILPTLLTTVVTTILGIILTKLAYKKTQPLSLRERAFLAPTTGCKSRELKSKAK